MRPSKRGAPSSAPEISPSKKPARPRRDAKSAIVAATKKEEDASSVKVDGDPGADENPSDAGGPFPTWRRPSPEECFAARDALALLHGEPGAIPPSPSSRAKTFSNPDGCDDPAGCASVLDSLVRTILSQNTTDATSCRAFRSLKGALPTWEQVRTAPVGVVEEAIRVGGLAEIKAARIRAILETLRAEALEKRRRVSKEEEEGAAAADSNGEGANALLSLEYLREWPDAERIKEELVRFNGVGPKTAACVVLFALRRADFPVDTHVHRISASLGWTPKAATREQAYEHLRRRVPTTACHDLHVLLVAHGKVCKRCASAGRGGGGGEKCAMRAAVAAAAEEAK